VRELDASLQQFGEFILKARLVKEKVAPYCVRWVRRFLTRPASDESLADQVRRFCERPATIPWTSPASATRTGAKTAIETRAVFDRYDIVSPGDLQTAAATLDHVAGTNAGTISAAGTVARFRRATKRSIS
jgi:hypothetical protein